MPASAGRENSGPAGHKRYWPDPRRHISPAARARRPSRAGGSGFSALPDHRAGPAGGQPRNAADYLLGWQPKILDASALSHLEQPPIKQGGGLRCRCNQLNAQPSAARTTHALCHRHAQTLTVSPLVRAAALAKTIMVLRNIVGTPFGTRRRPFD